MSRKKLNKKYGRSDVQQKNGRTDGHIDVQGNPVIPRYNKNYDICAWMFPRRNFIVFIYTPSTRKNERRSLNFIDTLDMSAMYSRTSLFRTRLFRITAYLEVKIWSLF